MSKNLIVCDLDGCLNYYPDTFLRWVEKSYGISKRDLTSLKKYLTREAYEILKQVYRTCGIKRTLAVRNGAIESLDVFRRLGKKIWISTSRPAIEPVRGDTEYWLRFNGIAHDKLTFLSKNQLKNHISKITEEIWFIVDDEYHIAVYMAEEFGIPVFLFENQPCPSNLFFFH